MQTMTPPPVFLLPYEPMNLFSAGSSLGSLTSSSDLKIGDNTVYGPLTDLYFPSLRNVPPQVRNILGANSDLLNNFTQAMFNDTNSDKGLHEWAGLAVRPIKDRTFS